MEKMESVELELQGKNKFLVEFPEQFGVQPWTVQKINKPKFTHGSWEDIKIVFVDPIGPSTSQYLYKIVNFLKSIPKTHESGSEILFDIKIKTLDPAHLTAEEWVVQVGKVYTINFGDLDYESNEMQRPYIIVEPIDCILCSV